MADELVEVQVYLRSSAPLNLSMSRVVILFVKEVHTYIHTYILLLYIAIHNRLTYITNLSS